MESSEEEGGLPLKGSLRLLESVVKDPSGSGDSSQEAGALDQVRGGGGIARVLRTDERWKDSRF